MRAKMTNAAVMLLARLTPYVESELLGLASVVGPGSVCLDAGAAAGLYSLALSQLAGPSGEVHSIEPLSFAHPVWRRVLNSQGGANVRYYPLALGSEAGPGVMSVPSGRYLHVTGRSFLAGKAAGLGPNVEFASHEDVPVAVDTIDALIERAGVTRLDFIKIDTEGGELHVLQGGERSIKEFRPAILVEIEARHTARYEYAPADLVDWLVERGYTMYTWRHGWQEASQVSLDRRNYLFRPDSPAALPGAGRS
ncbi:MAG: FkbM family methyltransferase [Streptosporangiaceae bacterium]